MALLGGAGGYATVSPIQGNPIGDAIQNVENSAFKYNAQRIADNKLKQDAAQQEQDLRDSRLKEDIAYTDKHKIPVTAVSSVNNAVLDFSVENKNMYSRAKDIVRISNNPDERRSAMETMMNLESSFEIAKALPEMLNASAKDLEEGVKGGKYNPLSSTNAAETIEAMNKGDMKVVFKPNGIPTFITYKRDGEGNITEVIDKELTLDQLKQKLAPIMAFDADTNNADFKKGLKEKTEWTDPTTGRLKEGHQGIELLAENNANSVISNRDKMYGIAPAAGVKPKINLADYTKEELDKVKNFIIDGFVEGYKPSDKRDYQSEQLVISQQGKSETARHNQAMENKKEGGEGEGKVRLTVKDGMFGKETSATRELSDSEYEAYLKENGVKKPVESPNVWNNPITTGISNAFKGKPKSETTKTTKYSSTQEQAIAAALKKNPGYTRAEIISALKI